MRNAAAISVILLALVGCVHPPAEAPAPSAFAVDKQCEPGLHAVALGEQFRAAQQPAVIPPHRTVLVLSGGGVYGAYSAGVLCGWTESGNRPTFDVVTGISTGALISVFAFLGSEYDAEIRSRYTTAKPSDIYRWKLVPWLLCTNSLTRSDPLRRQIESVITPEVVARIADAHCQGRRLYVGTSDLESRRPVIWDLGAIATSGQADSRELICKILLASASIPGLFPPVEITTEKNGRKCVEYHVDGGLTDPLFFRPPAEPCFGSDTYVIIAQKLYLDSYPVSPKVPWIVGSCLQTFLASQRRDAVVKVYLQTIFAGMHFQVTAIPSGFQGPKSDIDFDPAAMTRLFEEGRRQVLAGTAWSATPPGFGPDELLDRTGTGDGFPSLKR